MTTSSYGATVAPPRLLRQPPRPRPVRAHARGRLDRLRGRASARRQGSPPPARSAAPRPTRSPSSARSRPTTPAARRTAHPAAARDRRRVRRRLARPPRRADRPHATERRRYSARTVEHYRTAARQHVIPAARAAGRRRRDARRRAPAARPARRRRARAATVTAHRQHPLGPAPLRRQGRARLERNPVRDLDRDDRPGAARQTRAALPDRRRARPAARRDGRHVPAGRGDVRLRRPSGLARRSASAGATSTSRPRR